MTGFEFFRALPRDGWMEYRGGMRDRELRCPLILVCELRTGRRPTAWQISEAAANLGLPLDFAEDVARLSDGGFPVTRRQRRLVLMLRRHCRPGVWV